MKTKKKRKWCALANLQCQRIVASLNLYLRCTSVIGLGKMCQCVDICVYRPTCKMRLYPPHSRPLPKNRHPWATHPVPFIVGHCADSLDTVTVSSATSTRHPNTASDLDNPIPQLVHCGPWIFSVCGLLTSVCRNRMNKSLEVCTCLKLNLRVLKDTRFVFL